MKHFLKNFKPSSIFGTWTPPAWLKTAGAFISGAARAAVGFTARHKRVFIACAIALGALLVAWLGFSWWWARQPKLQEVSCTVEGPYPREYEEDPVSSVWLYFDGSAAAAEDAGNLVEDGITITPPVAGSWRWEEDTTLVFTPESEWPVGTQYTIEFAKDFFPDHLRIERTYRFYTHEFSANLSEGEFYIDPEDGAIKRVLATISANYPIDPASLEGAIKIRPELLAKSGTLENRDYQYSVTYDGMKRNAYIVSEPLGMPVDTVTVNITVARGIASSLGGSPTNEDIGTSVTVPGASDFISIDDVSHDLAKTPDQKYDQVVVVSTNGDIEEKEIVKSVSAWVLPVDRPEMPGIKRENDYSWDDAEFITDAVLKLSKPLKLELIPNELDKSAVNSFRFKADPGRYVYFKINAGTRFYGNYYLKNEYQTTFRIKQYPKEISILSDGAIVSLTGSKQLALLTREVGDVRFNVGRIRPDDINHLVSQSNGDLSSFSFENYRFNEYNVTEQYRDTAKVPLSGSGNADYFSFDFSRYLQSIPEKNLRYGLFVFSAQGNTADTERYKDKRLIMVTDLGFFVKTNADKTREVFVQSIGTGSPVDGAVVTVVGLNGNAIVSAATGADGHVSIPDLSGFKNEKAPVAYTVRKGEDLSFMPWRAEGRSLDYSSFNVGGISGVSDPKSVNAFLFSDRGMYRPGDTMHIGMIVKAGDWAINLARTPLECSIVGPNGAEVSTQRITLSADGFEEVSWKSEDYSPTGEYTASLYLIVDEAKKTKRFLGSETVKVEEFLPDNLTITASFSPLPKDGWIKPDKLDGVVTLRNLFGTAAAGNDVKAQINLYPGTQRFAKYRDYTFSDPYGRDNSYQEFLGTKQTDAEGSCRFPIDLAKFERATYRLSFYAEGFEKGGGRNVSQEASVYVSPLDYLVGYKADGDLSYINRDGKRNLSFVAINPETERCAVSGLTASLSEIRYISMLVKQPNGVYKYQSVRKSYPVKSDALSIPEAGLTYAIPTGKEGDFELTIADKDGLTYAKTSWSVIGEQNVERSLTRTAELEVKLDRQDVKNGEALRLFIKAPYAGSGLITIERDKVYSYAWFTANGTSSVQSIVVPEGLEGNGYVTVAFVRSVSSKEIFMSPLCYASVPFSVSRDRRTNVIKLDVPQEAKPGTDFAIEYSSSKSGKIVITAVDEGILQVAAYRTPDPLAFFFRKRALEVGTAQIMDLILPEFNVLRSLGATGGDGAMEELSRNLNPFKRKRNVPVAYWSGIVECGPDTRTVHYKIPDYFNGTLRVMAIAVSSDAVGATEEKTLVKNTFIITPNVPMMAAPGDEFDVAVTVTNNKKGSGDKAKLTLQAIPSEHLSVTGVAKASLDVPEGKDATAYFRVKANNVPGGAELKFVASDGAESVTRAETLSVRPAVPYRVTLASGSLKKGDKSVPVTRNVYENFATRSVALSYLPTGLAKGLYFYLEKYPYGCSEQVTSATWPLLYPNLSRDLGMNAAEARATIDRTISILQSRLKGDGTIGVWTSNSASELYLTNYCTLFLIEARAKGYYVPDSLMNSCLSGVRGTASLSGTDDYTLANRAFAIYILTRSETVTTSYIEKLKADMKNSPDSETSFAGLFLAGSYALLQKDFEATTLLGKIGRELKKNDSYRYIDALCYKSVYLDMVARHFPSRLRDVSADLLLGISAEIEGQRYTSLSANHALMAIESYLARTPGADSGSFGAEERDADKGKTELKLEGNNLFTATFSNKAAEIAIRNGVPRDIFYQVTVAGFDLELPKSETKQGIEVYREFCDASGKKSSSFTAGDEVLVKVTVRATDKVDYDDVAVVDMLPAGLEADIASIRNPGDGTSWSPDYVDVREDRVVFFGTVTENLQTFEYTARAINSGSFVVPPLFAEAMYDKSVWAYKPQDRLTIKSKQK